MLNGFIKLDHRLVELVLIHELLQGYFGVLLRILRLGFSLELFKFLIVVFLHQLDLLLLFLLDFRYVVTHQL